MTDRATAHSFPCYPLLPKPRSKPAPGRRRPGSAWPLLLAACLSGPLLSGCAAIHTSIAKRNLEVHTKMSDTVFLEPVAPTKKTIFVQVKNTTDQTNFDLGYPLESLLRAKGYRISSDPNRAYYWLRANVLNVSKTNPNDVGRVLGAGYGGALGGLALGSAIGSMDGWAGAGLGGLAGGMAGALAETVGNALVKDVMYMVVTDVEIAEQAKPGEVIRQLSQQTSRQGSSGFVNQTSSSTSRRKRYRVRIVSTANKVNLKYDEAVPELETGLARTISGVF